MLDSGVAGGADDDASSRRVLYKKSRRRPRAARITPRVDPPAHATMSPHGEWRESGGIVTLGWHYLVEVIPPADVECERWSLPARDYDVALTLHRAPSPPDAPEAAFTASFRLDALLDHVERDTGCALSVRDALLLLRLGLRGGAPVRDDDGSTWRRAFVDVETGTNPTSNPDSPSGHPRLLVTVRNVTYATSTTLALPPPGAAVRPGDASFAASTTIRALAASLAATRRRERNAVDALRTGARALRDVVRISDDAFAGDEDGSGNGGGVARSGRGTSGGLAGISPSRRAPPAGRRRRRAEAIRAAAEMEAAVARADAIAAGREIGEEENPATFHILDASRDASGAKIEEKDEADASKATAAASRGDASPLAGRKRKPGGGLVFRAQMDKGDSRAS